jgi:hypothetical protein
MDDLRLKKYFWTKRSSCKRRDLEWHLSEDDVEQLLTEAGITIEDVGMGAENYVLARYGDKGHYTMGNCRFILKGENTREWAVGSKRSPEARAKIASAARGRVVSEETKKKISKGLKGNRNAVRDKKSQATIDRYRRRHK